MTLGSTFINVQNDDVSTGDDPIAFRWGSLTDRLERLALGLGDQPGQWTLYLSRSDTLNRDISIPKNLLLYMAPGVVIRVGYALTWTLHGPTDLGSERRFSLDRRARIRLLGPLDDVRPIWWRESGDDPDDTSAIQAAVGVVLDRADLGLPQATILLQRPYWLDGTVTVRWEDPSNTGDGREVIVRGRHPLGLVGQPGSLNRRLSASTGRPLLRTRGAVRLVLQDVGIFDDSETLGAASSRAGVLLDLAGDVDGTVIERCTLSGGSASLLRIRHLPAATLNEQETVIAMLDGTVSVTEDQRASLISMLDRSRAGRVRISHCVFSRFVRIVGNDAVAVLRGAPVLLILSGSTFSCNAGNCIGIATGTVQAEDCYFGRERKPADDQFLDAKYTPTRFSERGKDVLRAHQWAAIVAGEVSPPRHPPPTPLSGISIIATHLTIRGLAVLSGGPLSADCGVLDATFVNVVQSGTFPGEFVVDLRGDAPGGALTLNGCALGGYVVVSVTDPGMFRIFDVGTRLPMGSSIEPPEIVRRLPR